MTLQQIRYVTMIAQAGSMNEAAKKLFISQPSLSGAIKELEKEVGIIIFSRTSKGVVLTAEGEEFLGYARQILNQVELLEEKYLEGNNVKKKFGVSTQHYSFAVKAFVEMVKAFDMDEYEFAIRETKTADVIRDVSTDKSQIGILYLNEFNEKVHMHMSGRTIRLRTGKRSAYRIFRNILVLHLSRETVIRSILQKKFSAHMIIRG